MFCVFLTNNLVVNIIMKEINKMTINRLQKSFKNKFNVCQIDRLKIFASGNTDLYVLHLYVNYYYIILHWTRRPDR